MTSKNNRNSNSIGQIFTPDSVAKFMVKNVVDILGVQNLPIKVLEPSVGEGIFLKNLIDNDFSTIHAYEIDKGLRESLLKSYQEVKFNFRNFLSSSAEEKFDLIIGNPPYLGQNYNAELFQEYGKKYPICAKYFVGNMDLFYYFIHLGIQKLKPGGILSFITTNYWITKSKKTGIKLLKPHVLNECYILQYIDLSNLKLFKGAKGQHNCIFVLQKKTEQEKSLNLDKSIKIVQVRKKDNDNLSDAEYNDMIFRDLINEAPSENVMKYKSALTNNDLKGDGSWNLTYPGVARKLVDHVENYCVENGKKTYLKDYFLIRNGLIFIKDEIFILKEDKDLKVEEDSLFVKINGKFVKIPENEKDRLKKVYKSKSIKPYGFNSEGLVGYAIYFNIKEFQEEKYEVLPSYLNQFKQQLREILINAKENPKNIYFPRRGAYIRRKTEDGSEELVNLETYYDNNEKVFLKYISRNNIFGYSKEPYYATSDTYFLWPIDSKKEINYPFFLAYLNSKVVNFLFRAKNISIKRSKTKLEDNLPVPNLTVFNSEKDISILTLIKFLSSFLIDLNQNANKLNINRLSEDLSNLDYFLLFKDEKRDFIAAIKSLEEKNIQNQIDELFFKLFRLNEKEIDDIILKYY